MNPETGYCECGCGGRTEIARNTSLDGSVVKGEPRRFMQGHRKGKLPRRDLANPDGLCLCGCGGKTPIALKTRAALGHLEGQPVRFIEGHNNRRPESTAADVAAVVRITGCEARPCVTERGVIVSADGRVFTTKPDKEVHELKASLDQAGYLRVGLHHHASNASRRIFVHALLCDAFHGPRPTPSHQTRHLDGNKLNNVSSNVCWGTARENVHDRAVHGTDNRGTRNGNTKLTVDGVRAIRRRLAAGESTAAIAESVGVSATAVRHIRNGSTWSHLT